MQTNKRNVNGNVAVSLFTMEIEICIYLYESEKRHCSAL